MRTSFAVIGGGAVGLATAADLVRRGCSDLRICETDAKTVEALRKAGGVRYDGLIGSGFAPVRLITTSHADAVDGADVVMVSTTADAHPAVAAALAPILVDGQVVLLHQGYLAGALLFERNLRTYDCHAEVVLAETGTSVYSCARMAPNAVFVNGVKAWTEITSFPAGVEEQIIAMLGKAFPQLEPGTNTLETGLNNPNPSGHIPDYVFNLGLAKDDRARGTFHFRELWTEPVQRVKAQMESERLAVMSAMGFDGLTRDEFVRRCYPPGSGTRILAGAPRIGPELLPRYIWEDVPAGLVPLVALAAASGVKAPVCQMILDVVCLLFEADFVENGRNLQQLGIGELGPGEIIALFKG